MGVGYFTLASNTNFIEDYDKLAYMYLIIIIIFKIKVSVFFILLFLFIADILSTVLSVPVTSGGNCTCVSVCFTVLAIIST